MRKNVYLFVFLSAIIGMFYGCSSYSARQVTDFEKENLKGNVENVKTISISSIGAKKERIYNSEGCVIEEYSLFVDSRGEISRIGGRTIYDYQEDNKTLKSKLQYSGDILITIGDGLDKPNKEKEKYETREYDKNGNLIKLLIYPADEQTKKRIGRKAQYISTWSYDQNNRKISDKTQYASTDRDGNVTYKCVSNSRFEYNENGDMINNIGLNSDDKIISTTTSSYEYDDKGNWITKYVAGKKTEVRIIKYRGEAEPVENFDLFIKTFNSLFNQKERIKFPLYGYSVNEPLESGDFEVVKKYYTENDWQKKIVRDESSTNSYYVINKGDYINISYYYNSVYVIFSFKLFDNKWFLTEYEERGGNY